MATPLGAIVTGYDLYLASTNPGWVNRPPRGIPDHCFTNDTNEWGQPIIWTHMYPAVGGISRTLTYQPFPIEATGFSFDGEELPRPRLKVANVNQMIGGIVRGEDDLVGSKVCRWRTFAKYLDDANFRAAAEPGWVSQHDSTAYFPPDIYIVESKLSENKLFVEFELSSAMDVGGIRLPRRQVMANACPFKYRGVECGYAGPDHPIPGSFDTQGNPITDGCDKGLTTGHGCRAHWGTAQAAFGGFPAAGRRRSG